MSRDMTREEVEVCASMRNGELGPLSELLGAEGDLHPLIQRELRIMITGWAKRSYRLKLVLNVHHKQAVHANGAKRSREIRLTERALDLGAAERGKRDGAVKQAWEEMVRDEDISESEATAMTWYKRRHRFVRFFRHHMRLERQ